MPHHDPAEFPHFDPTETREQMRERLQHGTGTTTTRLSRAQVERLLRMASGARTPEEIGVDFDLTEIRALARDALAYMTALEHIRDTMGRVCEDFEICGHVACADSCGAVLVALGALNGEPLP